MDRIGLSIGICWALMYGSASAQVPSEFAIIDTKLEACLVKADGVTPGIDNCNERAKISADLILNPIYGDWVEQLKHPAKEQQMTNRSNCSKATAKQFDHDFRQIRRLA